MSTIKVDTINTRTGSGNITFSRPTVLTAGDIVAADIATDAVTTVKIAADAVDGTKIADNAVDSEHYTAGSIDNAHLADDAVNSDELAAGAVDLAHMSATGTASSSTFLRGDNSWAAAGGGGFELLASTNASNASSIDFEATATGFTVADYTQFLIILTGIYPNTSTQLIQLQTDASDGASYQTDGYTYAIHSIDFDGLEETHVSGSAAGQHLTAAVISTTGVVNYAVQGTIWLNIYGAAGGSATRSLKSHSNMSWTDSASDQKVSSGMGYGAHENGPYNAFRIMAASGNITGRATLYGAKIA